MSKYDLPAEQKPIVTIDDFMRTYSGETSSGFFAKKAVDFLTTRDSLPLTYLSKSLPDINIFAAWFFWSGNINHEYTSDLNIPSLFVNDLESLTERLGTGLNTVDSGGENIYYLRDNGAIYNRLLGLLGIPISKGTKKKPDTRANHKIELPQYVRFLADNFSELRGEEKLIATNLISDQCKVLLFSRAAQNYRGFRVGLPSDKHSETDDEAKELARQVVHMFNSIFPRIGLDEDSIKVTKSKKRRMPLITLTEENVHNSKIYGLFHTVVRPTYHPLGKRTTCFRQ